jgi:endonuclease/exonuclease/phosphatase family metal-dependent hydrolase
MEGWRLRAPSGREFVVASVHLPSPREGIKGFLERGETSGLTAHAAWWGREMGRLLSALLEERGVPLLIGGDFNMPPDASTFAAMLATFRSAFSEAGWGYGYTRPARFSWVRIDHILTTPDWSITECRVGPDFGSDHLPVVAEVCLPQSEP